MATARRSSLCNAAVLLGLVVLAVCCTEVLVAGATQWTVGDSRGWTFNVAGWENGKAFAAGDVLVFNYGKSAHNVVHVDKAGYDACSAGAGARSFSSGNDRITHSRGKAFFICSFAGHCASGMKIAVTVK
ncbi:hypothetical protein GUJ93_ZPchr0002g25927 [Zizania palustris]|uniref:Plantacyanin n=1 Tax=Zizania palustris TaxID=103762 RepID=A0A8J5RQH9_ZIZPA|nr:hypothetical protein GUJ93_ZPchr0002g25927 [Zizania palustris]